MSLHTELIGGNLIVGCRCVWRDIATYLPLIRQAERNAVIYFFHKDSDTSHTYVTGYKNNTANK